MLETLLKETNVLERGIQNLCDEKYKQFLDSVQSIITMKKDVASVQVCRTFLNLSWKLLD